MSTVKPFITVKATLTGFHWWDGAPIEAEFLKNIHRHNFIIRVSLWVSHLDRAREFTMVKNDMGGFFKGFKKNFDGLVFGPNSCEMLAVAMRTYLITEKGYKPEEFRFVSFSEDGEFEGGIEC